MSTKTSLLKRIAQTAVVALVGGLLSTIVAPAANAANPSSISATCVARAGVGGWINVTSDGDGVGLLKAKQTSRVLAGGGTYTLQQNVLGGAGYTIDSSTTSHTFQLMADTITTGVTSITYLVWLDYDAGKATPSVTTGESPDVANDVSTTVTCNVAGAPTSFALSATSASIAGAETATFTITPKDANGFTTMLIKGSGATGETITVTGSQASTGTARLGIASGVDTSATGTRTTFDGGRSAGQKHSAAAQYMSTAQVLATYSSGASGQATETGSWFASWETGTVKTAAGLGTSVATRPRIELDYTNTDARGQFIPAASVAGLDGKNAAESAVTTGAFTVNVSATGAAAATFTVAGAGDIAGATASTFSLTTGVSGYATNWSFGSAAATGASVAGLGLRTSAYGEVPGLTTPDTYGDKTVTVAGSASTAASKLTANAASYVASTVTGKTVNLKLHSGTSEATVPVTIAAQTGVVVPAGITTGTFNYTTVGDGTETSVVIALAATDPLPGQGYKVSWKADATTTYTLNFTYQAPTVDSTRGSVVQVPTPISTAKNVVSGSNTLEVTVRDQFYDLVSGATVLMSISGRNAVTASSKTTDALGKATFTWTDAGAVLTGTAGSATGTTDVVTITAQTSNATSAAATSTATTTTITYSATLTAGTVTLSNNGATAGVAAGSCATYTATVLDTNGIALSGFPVTFTGNANTYFSSVANSVTAFTGAAGTATASFCGKLVGTATVTAVSGGITKTSSHTVIAGTQRTISVDATAASMAPGESKRVTATVKDAFGNVDPDVAVTVAYTGTAGRVASVNGVASATATTNASGQVVVELSADSAGTGTLTLTITGGNTSTATTLGDGSAMPARVTSTTTAVTVTGTSAAVAAAEAASDAAAEAIDAANAATDAANLAAEAADAATVAAEEARDAADAATAAVEELATQVATLMAALKAQITTLANTVAKIAKKVRA
jgi:hypothetical protein